MAIYLDSNVLYPWRTFTELDRVAVSIVSQQIRQIILVPWMVYEEASANYHRTLAEAAEGLDSAVQDVNRKFDDLPDVYVDPTPDVDVQLQKWQQRLDNFVRVISHKDAEATEALRREAWRVAPARASGAARKAHGIGGRDAAVWLAICRDHNARHEPGHLISRDGDLGIRDRMIDDIASTEELTIYESIEEFLALLGTARGIEKSAIDLSSAEGSVRVALEATLDIPLAVFETLDPDVRYRARVKTVEPLGVLGARAYDREGDEGLVVVDSEWQITADVLHVPRRLAEGGAWWAVEDVTVRGTIQMYFPDVNHPDVMPQLINARLTSDTRAYYSGDRMITMRPAEQHPGR